MVRPLIVPFIKYFIFINVMDLLSTHYAEERPASYRKWSVNFGITGCELNLLPWSYSMEGRVAKTFHNLELQIHT